MEGLTSKDYQSEGGTDNYIFGSTGKCGGEAYQDHQGKGCARSCRRHNHQRHALSKYTIADDTASANAVRNEKGADQLVVHAAAGGSSTTTDGSATTTGSNVPTNGSATAAAGGAIRVANPYAGDCEHEHAGCGELVCASSNHLEPGYGKRFCDTILGDLVKNHPLANVG